MWCIRRRWHIGRVGWMGLVSYNLPRGDGDPTGVEIRRGL